MPLYINLVERTTEYVVKSTYRYLFKRKRVYKFETLVLNFIRKQGLNKNFYKESRDSLKDLKREAGKLLKDPFEKNVFQYFHFLAWLESKIEKRPFAGVAREKAYA